MKDAGVLIGLSRPLGNVFKFRPPLVVDEGGIDGGLGALDGVLTAVVQ
jgi:4-aminobutyrate aminotransferase-like enzyme